MSTGGQMGSGGRVVSCDGGELLADAVAAMQAVDDLIGSERRLMRAAQSGKAC